MSDDLFGEVVTKLEVTGLDVLSASVMEDFTNLAARAIGVKAYNGTRAHRRWCKGCDRKGFKPTTKPVVIKAPSVYMDKGQIYRYKKK